MTRDNSLGNPGEGLSAGSRPAYVNPFSTATSSTSKPQEIVSQTDPNDSAAARPQAGPDETAVIPRVTDEPPQPTHDQTAPPTPMPEASQSAQQPSATTEPTSASRATTQGTETTGAIAYQISHIDLRRVAAVSTALGVIAFIVWIAAAAVLWFLFGLLGALGSLNSILMDVAGFTVGAKMYFSAAATLGFVEIVILILSSVVWTAIYNGLAGWNKIGGYRVWLERRTNTTDAR